MNTAFGKLENRSMNCRKFWAKTAKETKLTGAIEITSGGSFHFCPTGADFRPGEGMGDGIRYHVLGRDYRGVQSDLVSAQLISGGRWSMFLSKFGWVSFSPELP